MALLKLLKASATPTPPPLPSRNKLYLLKCIRASGLANFITFGSFSQGDYCTFITIKWRKTYFLKLNSLNVVTLKISSGQNLGQFGVLEYYPVLIDIILYQILKLQLGYLGIDHHPQ